MDRLLQDFWFAARSLARNPSFAVVALLTLALGIGANAAMFSLVNGILLRPLPYAEPDRLVQVHSTNPEYGGELSRISPLDLEDWRERTSSFEWIAGYLPTVSILTGIGEPAEVATAFVTDDFFDLFGRPTHLGRPLVDEDTQEAARSVVVSDRFWRSRLSADAAALGRTLTLNGESYAVVGVMPDNFRFPAADTDFWMPHAVLGPDMIGPLIRENRHLEGIARLRTGVAPEVARAELAAVATQLAAEYPATNSVWRSAEVVPLRDALVGEVGTALVVVLSVVGLILLIGCVNVANLLLARGSTRSREIAIRTALGAGRRRLIRQLLSESLLLGIGGGALGLLVAVVGLEAVIALSVDTLPRVEDVGINATVVVFAFLLSLLTTLLFGILPAMRTSGDPDNLELRGGRGSVGNAKQGLRHALVVAEVALAVILVIGAGLMARSFLELRSVHPGFEVDGALTVSIQFNLEGVEGPEIGEQIVSRRQEIARELMTLPGVTEVGVINTLPLHGSGEPFEFTRRDGTGLADGAPLRADRRYISNGYLGAMGIPLLRGEPLPEEVTSLPLPILISESAARQFWPGEDAVGQIVQADWGEGIIAGVVGDVRQIGLAAAPAAAVYFPQSIGPRINSTFVIRAAGDPLALARPVRQTIHRLDPNQPIRSITTLRGVMSESIARDRFFTLLFGFFGGLGLTLAAVGIYGVLAYSVGQRTQEIGLRMALGAGAGDVLKMIVRNGMLLVGGGMLIGTVLGMLLSRVLESQLFGIRPNDPATLAAALGVLGVVALFATYLPARRATRVDPLTALRAD